jgi:hypothetical protein
MLGKTRLRSAGTGVDGLRGPAGAAKGNMAFLTFFSARSPFKISPASNRSMANGCQANNQTDITIYPPKSINRQSKNPKCKVRQVIDS